MRCVGVTSRGIRLPVLKDGDDLENIVVESLLEASKEEGFKFKDKDVIGITESIVARCQGNYASVDAVAKDVKTKTGGGNVGVIFPILSRNRFSIILKGIARGCQKVTLLLSYPSDEVGNALLSQDDVDSKGVNPYTDVLSLKEYRDLFGYKKHEFTGVDYIDFYTKLIEGEGAEAEVIFANHATAIKEYTNVAITADIHTRFRNKRLLKEAGLKVVLGLDDILNKSVDGSGFNSKYGLLGSNKSSEELLKLFPNDGQALVENIQRKLKEATGKHIEVMVYGDGAFKDPQGKIWELADPVVSPFHTSGLKGTPNELKLKYLADNEYSSLKGEELAEAIKNKIKEKEANLVGQMVSEGTTPRQLTDLLGSLCDLTSGSGDKGTPVIHISGYFDNYSSN